MNMTHRAAAHRSAMHRSVAASWRITICLPLLLWGLSSTSVVAQTNTVVQTGAAAQETPAPAVSPAIISAEFIYESAPFPQCHASTIVETPEGLVAAWFGGTHEKHPDVGIWLAQQRAGRWTAPREIATGVEADGTRYPTWNPVLFQPRKGPLVLFYKVGPDPMTWWGMMMTSPDAGSTWSRPERLPDGILGPIKNKPIELAEGEWLSPTSSESRADGWRVHFERTRDAGHTWSKTPAVNDGRTIGAIQPSLLRLDEQRLLAVGRTKQGRVFQVESFDRGATWGEMGLTELPNPNSGTDAVTLADGRQLLVYNHTPKGRSPLNVAVSMDGRAWRMALALETQPGEYSYPAVIQSAAGRVHITYTYQRKRIRHVVIDPARL